jgi:hypothetical protein
MTNEVKDWHEGHLNGYNARTVADYIWTEAQPSTPVSSFSGFSGGHDPLPLTRCLPVASPFPVESLGPTMRMP